MLVFYEMIYLQHPFEQLILVHFSNLVVVANSFAGYGGGAFSGTHDDICKNAQSWISRIPNYLFLSRLFTTATVNYSFFLSPSVTVSRPAPMRCSLPPKFDWFFLFLFWFV